ncbi:MAG: hypothetical protein WC773_03180 [Patescibacteria group bacterium]
MATVQPISARKVGELARLLEERGVGDDDFQKALIEHPDQFVTYVKSKLPRPAGRQLLELWYSVVLPALTGFDLREKFAQGAFIGDEVRIEKTSDEFRSIFTSDMLDSENRLDERMSAKLHILKTTSMTDCTGVSPELHRQIGITLARVWQYVALYIQDDQSWAWRYYIPYVLDHLGHVHGVRMDFTRWAGKNRVHFNIAHGSDELNAGARVVVA